MTDPEGVWRDVPADVRTQVDVALRRRRDFEAMVLLCHDSAGPLLGLVQAQEVAAHRFIQLAALGEVPPEPAVQLGDLQAKADVIDERVVAIEAVWDGDTKGWHVALLAIVERASQEHPRFHAFHLATLRLGTDLRVFNGQVPPWPEADLATHLGQSLAQHLQVPFYFAHPDTPDIDHPRCWDTID